MKTIPEFTDFDSYFALQTEENRNYLEKLRTLIKSVAPEAIEVISYGIPMFKYHGMLIGLAAFKKHLSIFPGAIVDQFKNELKAFKTSKGTVQFTLDRPIPDELLVRIVKAGMERNDKHKSEKK